MGLSVEKLSVWAVHAIAIGLAAAASPELIAQDATDPADTEQQQVETIITIGTRAPKRTAFDSLAPVDVINAPSLDAGASDEFIDVLGLVAPSFNVQRLPLNDGLIFVRPATLRGLSPDHTLLLVNGKRRHRSALLGTRGAQGADLAQIPTYAIKRVEVLRDGASAQYGSDAIGGVINVILDDEPGYRGFAQGSQYYAGDGEQVRIGAQGDAPIGSIGFVTGSVEYSNASATSRTRQRPDAIAFQEANPTLNVPNPVQRWGQPDREVWRFAMNAGIALGQIAEGYTFATFGFGEGLSDFNWRNPDGTSAFAPSAAFPNFDLRSVYPTGFTPRFGQEDHDYSVVGGARGALGNGVEWDLSLTRGQNKIDYFIDETINASLGPESPTSFRPGTLRQSEFNLNADFNYAWSVDALASPVNVAFGAERRVETYEIGLGDPASFAVGPGAADGLPSGSNGFPGFSELQAGEFDQESYAAYVDVEAPLTDALTLAAALRHEDFSEFGSTTDYKVSGRYQLSPTLALRATASTGFRAPTPGQIGGTRTTQGLDTVTLDLFTSGRLSPNNPIAVALGAMPLRPEESENYSFGVAWTDLWGISGSVDAYRVDVTDRFGESRLFTVTDEIRAAAQAQGIPDAESFAFVSFFGNAFDTRTQGVDLVASYSRPVGPGDLRLTGAINWNDTEVTDFDPDFLSSLDNPPDVVNFQSGFDVVRIEDGVPAVTGNLEARYDQGRVSVLGRARYYGEWTDVGGVQPSGDVGAQTFGDLVLFDASISIAVTENTEITVGAENLFDSFPDEAEFQANRGLIYSRNAPYDTDGGQYYLRLNLAF